MRGRPSKFRIHWNRGEPSRREASTKEMQEPEDYVNSEWNHSKSKTVSRFREGAAITLYIC